MSAFMRKSFITGMIFGRIDWISTADGQVGLYLRTQDNGADSSPIRCVLKGVHVEHALAKKTLTKGCIVAVSGTMAARAWQHQDGSIVSEVVCYPFDISLEPESSTQFRGSIYVNVKGVVMNWDLSYMQVKTYFNAGVDGRIDQFTASVSLRSWVKSLADTSREKFLLSVKPGREYTASCYADVGYYKDRSGKLSAVMRLLPCDFRLQG